MTKQKKHAQYGADVERILGQFSETARPGVEEIWTLSKKARTTHESVSENEIEEALENVHFRIHEEKKTNRKSPNITGFILSKARYLVAAIALIVVGLGIFMVPKTFTVPNAETAVIKLPDGSTVEMNSGSTIQYNRLFSFTNRKITLNGEAYFLVEKGKHPFIVEANGAAIEVTGTQFNIRSWPTDPSDETTVTVTEGHVKFYPTKEPSKTVILKKGQTSRLNSGMISPSLPEETASDEHLAWRENRLVFQETPLIVILNDLERAFDVTLNLDEEGMEYETLTAYYKRPANIETILEDICTVKGLRYTKTTNGYRIFK